MMIVVTESGQDIRQTLVTAPPVKIERVKSVGRSPVRSLEFSRYHMFHAAVQETNILLALPLARFG